ncbi:MAG: T9SS type A sorting domain-containing protein, partial [Ignavibacteriaceae bacterium]|nr:T9SS type A sorting domain-containing protein [Ignavibacteriaceae bacterium]
IYLAAYPTVLTALGRTKPGVYDEIINSVNRGTVILNYIGHGSPELWAHERVFVKSTTIPLMKNDKYFFLTAATCDFGYYDIPGTQSATEAMITKEGSGAIGVFSASRPVYSQQNANLNEALFTSMLSNARDTLNLPIPVGKAYMKAKLTGSGDIHNDNKFHLFCDPTLRLNIPQYLADFDSVNGQNLSIDVQLKALSNTSIEGRIKKSSSVYWDDFNGEGTLTVFDSKRQVKLDPLSSPTNPFYMTVQGGIIFRGRTSIVNGHFSTNFIVPKDISYENANGKILLYFSSDNVDGLGYTSKVKIGGTDSTAVNDGAGPDIEIFFDDENQGNTTLVNPNSLLIIKLNDGSGINTTGTGVGHKLEGILNDKTNEPIDFTNYFTGDLDAGGQSGAIRYRFNNLEPGEYKMLVKAWDVFNNPSSEEIFFTVVQGNDLTITDVYNFPNPFSSSTTFTFQKNNINSPVDVEIKVYSVAGRLIRNLDAKSINDNFVKIDWDGRDEDGNIIANGAYLYKLIVKSADGNFTKNILGKLAVVR